jgi:hypothetical protein
MYPPAILGCLRHGRNGLPKAEPSSSLNDPNEEPIEDDDPQSSQTFPISHEERNIDTDDNLQSSQSFNISHQPLIYKLGTNEEYNTHVPGSRHEHYLIVFRTTDDNIMWTVNPYDSDERLTEEDWKVLSNKDFQEKVKFDIQHYLKYIGHRNHDFFDPLTQCLQRGRSDCNGFHELELYPGDVRPGYHFHKLVLQHGRNRVTGKSEVFWNQYPNFLDEKDLIKGLFENTDPLKEGFASTKEAFDRKDHTRRL